MLDTSRMAQIALELAELSEMPMDSGVQAEKECVTRVLAGIDMGTAEVFAAHQMGYDCVARHHNLESTMAAMGAMIFHDHRESMIVQGVPMNIAESIAQIHKKEADRNFHASNFEAASQMAKLLGIGFVGLHTPADLLGERLVQARMDVLMKENPRCTVGDVLEVLMTIREYRETRQGPEVWVGEKENLTGRIFVRMAGGVGPKAEEYTALIEAGIGTFVVMHLDKATEEKLSENRRCNIIVAGHMASDSIGFNKILDAWEKEGDLKIDRIGGIV